MATKKYHGSCHCQKIKFTVELDITTGTGRCNCTFCTKARWWGKIVKPEAFTLLSGNDSLSDYTKQKPLTFEPGEKVEVNSGHHLFCKTCGVRPFGKGHIPEIGGEYYSVNIACLDDVDFKEVMNAPIQFFDGRTNNWFNTPEFTGHL
jgi:hypothetical protein